MSQQRDTQDYNDTDTLEIDIALKLSMIEGCFKFLHYINFDKQDAPRNETERQSIKNNLERVQDLRELYRTLLRKHKIVSTTVPAVQIANTGCMQPTKGDQYS